MVAADIASGVDASTGEVEGAAVEAEVTVSFHAAKLGHWIAPGKRHAGELRVAPIGIPDGAPAQPPAGLIIRSVLELLAAARRRLDQVQLRPGADRRRLARAHRRGLHGGRGRGPRRRRLRDGRRPAELEPIFEIKLTEVMSIGCPSADGRLAPAAAERILAAAERAAAVVLGPGLGRGDGARRARRRARAPASRRRW